ncbi:Uncharacterised protein [Anaerobiospirillum thomasii]|uniref:Periplasmic protein n=1 Tax=Anaerobiospirillum thomasii TaxID=179995 RepID=A0A2X0VBH5_9GAMM|nr:hypothetical protein [Anaerobiospirillum thomasii]SPT68061.1 Uncharacterised protein [Anaerobiospirillum thomasii]SPT70526.1 Uncharacterised protein [Anaerobiospirillum thomasii]
MKNYTKLALGSVVALAFAATSALAVPPVPGPGAMGPGPAVNGECPYGFDKVGPAPAHFKKAPKGPRGEGRLIHHPRHVQHFLFLKSFINNEKYSKDAHVLVTLNDTIFAEKKVLDGLVNASSPDVSAIRKQAMSLRNLERKEAELQIAFYDRVIKEDPALLKDVACPFIQDKIRAAKPVPPAPEAQAPAPAPLP